MRRLRHHIAGHRSHVALLLAVTLLMKLLVPAGFMPDVSAGHVAIVLCPGSAPTELVAAMPGMHHSKSADRHHGGAESPCPYASLSAPGLSGADPLQLALALLFIVAVALLPAPTLALERVAHLRPPLRGPPSPA